MTIATPSIRQDSKPRRIGRPSAEDLEERRPIMQALHVVEGHAFGALAENLHTRTNLHDSRQHDAQADAHVDTLEALGWLLQAADLTRADVHLIGRAVVAHARRQRHHDTLEDAAVDQGAHHAQLVTVELHHVTAFVEQTATGGGQ